MGIESGITLTCHQCGNKFIFTESEQQFYQQKGFTSPSHCKECRSIRRVQASHLCSKCGKKINDISEVRCVSCLESVRLEMELETRNLRGLLDEVNAKLIAAESEKAQLTDAMNAKMASIESEKLLLSSESEAKLGVLETEKAGLLQEFEKKLGIAETEKLHVVLLLEQEKKLSADLQEKFDKAGVELEKALKYRAALEYLDPALNSIGMKLEALERNQQNIKQTLLQFSQNVDEITQNRFEFFKRFFRIGRKSASGVN